MHATVTCQFVLTWPICWGREFSCTANSRSTLCHRTAPNDVRTWRTFRCLSQPPFHRGLHRTRPRWVPLQKWNRKQKYYKNIIRLWVDSLSSLLSLAAQQVMCMTNQTPITMEWSNHASRCNVLLESQIAIIWVWVATQYRLSTIKSTPPHMYAIVR